MKIVIALNNLNSKDKKHVVNQIKGYVKSLAKRHEFDVNIEIPKEKNIKWTEIKCPSCAGTGTAIYTTANPEFHFTETCERCGGTGVAMVKEENY